MCLCPVIRPALIELIKSDKNMKHFRFGRRMAAIGFFLLLSFRLHAAEVTIFAAASLTDVLNRIAADYSRESRDRILFNFAGSSTLARQIEEGAPVDIFFSADEAMMDALEKKGRIVRETRVSRLSNTLVIVVSARDSKAIRSWNDLTNATVARIALADPKAVPAGVYARAFLTKQNLWSAVEPKVIPTENVRGALAAVEAGNVDAGIVYKTDAAISKRVKIAVEISREEGPAISYPVALVSESRQPEAAKRFLQFLNSAAAAKAFEGAGFIVRH